MGGCLMGGCSMGSWDFSLFALSVLCTKNYILAPSKYILEKQLIIS